MKYPGRDGKVRRASVKWRNFRVGERMQEYKGVSEAVTASRSVQHLALLVPDNYGPEKDDMDFLREESTLKLA